MELSASPENVAIAQRGEPLIVSGSVYRQDCVTPLAGATIRVWHVDADGDYGPARADGSPVCCYLQGTLRSGSKGDYRFETIVPSQYRDFKAPAHIHFDVVHPQAAGIITELQFAGDPYLSAGSDAVAVVSLDRSGTPIRARFDIVLRDR